MDENSSEHQPQSQIVQPAHAEPVDDAVTPRNLRLWLRDLLVSVAASVLIITFLYQPVKVEGTSMLPRLEDQTASSSTNSFIDSRRLSAAT